VKLPTLTVTASDPAVRFASLDQLLSVHRTRRVLLRFRIFNPKPGEPSAGPVALTYEGATDWSDMVVPAGSAIEYEMLWPPHPGDPSWAFETNGLPKYPALFAASGEPDVLIGVEVA
jgi:hypothetical protein